MTTGVPPESPNKSHPRCWTHRHVWRMTCEDFDELRAWSGHRCAFCRNPHPLLNVDHDHELGYRAVRGLLCPSCNAGRMKSVDQGYLPIDDKVRAYLTHPWYLDRHGKALGHDPRVHVCVNDLSANDRAELQRHRTRYPDAAWLSGANLRFEHPGIAACLKDGDIRPVLRLLLLDLWHVRDLDIATTTPLVHSWVTAQALHKERAAAICDHSGARPEFDTNGNPVRLTCVPPCTRQWTVRTVNEAESAA